jgi:hypothetical protein
MSTLQQLQQDKMTIMFRLKFRKNTSRDVEGFLDLLKSINKRINSIMRTLPE